MTSVNQIRLQIARKNQVELGELCGVLRLSLPIMTLIEADMLLVV